MKNKTLIAVMLGSAIAFCGAQSHAAITWTYSTSSTSVVAGNTIAVASGGVTATAKAYSNTDDGTAGTGNAALGSTSRTTAANYKLETAYLASYGSLGLGVNNRDGVDPLINPNYGDQGDLASTAPEHAVDNNQRYDSVLFSFGSNKVNLTSMTTGYVSGDSDFTVWYYSGLGTPTLSGNTYASLGAGWTLLGSYDGHDGSSQSPHTENFTNTKYSSYWLIGAYNELVGGSKTGTLDAGDDAFKIAKLTGNVCTSTTPGCGGGSAAPEPGTLLLMGAGLAGLVRTTRRRQAAAA